MWVGESASGCKRAHEGTLEAQCRSDKVGVHKNVQEVQQGSGRTGENVLGAREMQCGCTGLQIAATAGAQGLGRG